MTALARAARPLVVAVVLLAAWQAVVWLGRLPPYILPGPAAVLRALWLRWPLLAQHGLTTLAEMLLGLVAGTGAGVASGLVMTRFALVRRWLMPLILISQALPVFALAPLLVLWLGYGVYSKVAMAAIVIFFPVASAFYDGLRRTESGWLDLARTMDATPGAVLWRLRLPAALPALGSGLRIAAAVAPIGAVIGEWVGSSAGLGYLMLNANGRMQVDLLFAALAILALLSVALYAAVDRLVRWATPWAADALPPA